MAAKAKNPVWAFLASVRLALLLIGLLASTSIIGTIVQQNKEPEHYVQAWGKTGAAVIDAFNFNDMYNSVWFLCLLGAFSLNLTVCSIDRLPGVIRQARKDNLDIAPEQLLKTKMQHTVPVGGSAAAAAEKAAAYLRGKGWNTARRDKEAGQILLFAQKGPWTRYGVYVVHISILIILLGAVIGSPTVAKKLLKNPQFAFKGGVLLPETRATSRIFSYEDESEIPLGFTVRCNFFDRPVYDNGMPKDYISSLTVIENDKEVLTKKIRVNHPLTYKGVTFYQSSYNDMHRPIIHLTDTATGRKMVFPVNPQQWNETHSWQDESGGQGMVRIQEAESVPSPSGKTTTQMKIWLMDAQGPPSMFSMFYNQPVIVERPGAKYELRVGPHYATGLQVAKDPGVWWVYSGCALMLIGLYAAFFMSHRKIWALLRQNETGQAEAVFVGSANKNSAGFAAAFAALAEEFGKKSN
jgi:cytochrome c biogenesis protein